MTKPKNRNVLRDLLTFLGFEDHPRGKMGSKKVELARSEKPDLILTDLIMPVMDGFDAVKAIRQFDQEVSIIAISASVFEAERLISPLCNAFLPKPVEIQKLLALIEKELAIEWLYAENSSEPKQTEEPPLIPPPTTSARKCSMRLPHWA